MLDSIRIHLIAACVAIVIVALFISSAVSRKRLVHGDRAR